MKTFRSYLAEDLSAVKKANRDKENSLRRTNKEKEVAVRKAEQDKEQTKRQAERDKEIEKRSSQTKKESIVNKVISLPIYPELSNSDSNLIANAMSEFFK